MTKQTYIAFIPPTLIDITKSLVKGKLDRYKSFTNSLVKADKENGTLYKEENITVNCYQYMSRMKFLSTSKRFEKQTWEKSTISERLNNNQFVGKIIESKENNSTSNLQHT